MLQLKQLSAGNKSEWLVEKRYTFGTGLDNHYTVVGEGVVEIHAGLEVSGDHVQLFNLGGGSCVTVNGEILEKNQVLRPGDEFSVGDTSFKVEDPKQNYKAKPKVDPKLVGWTLRAKNTALENKSFPLEGSKSIGRSKECDICLNVVHLSRRHAQITVKENYLQVDDLNSSNGTYVNGKRVETAQVKSGDEIGFDTLKFLVIGPATSLEKTQVRQETLDSDATTMRPVIRDTDAIAEHEKKTTPKRKTREELRAKAAEVSQPASSSEKPSSSSNTGALLFGVILIAIAAAAAYVFLS